MQEGTDGLAVSPSHKERNGLVTRPRSGCEPCDLVQR
jgi:hypothetical protein